MNAHHAKIDVYYLVTDHLIALLEQGIIPWHIPWRDGRAPRSYSTGRRYQGIAAWLLNALGYEHNLFLLWDEVRALGGSVKPGERGHAVGFFKECSIPQMAALIPRYTLVFNVAQCTGLPNLPGGPKQDPDPLQLCELIVRNMPHCPPIVSGRRKGYDGTMDTITMHRIDQRTEDYYAALFGYLVRSTSHPQRLNRKPLELPAGFAKPFPVEELVIELATCSLCHTAGIAPSSLPDIAGYCSQLRDEVIDHRMLIIMVSYLAHCAVEYIMGNEEDAQALLHQLTPIL